MRVGFERLYLSQLIGREGRHDDVGIDLLDVECLATSVRLHSTLSNSLPNGPGMLPQ